MEFSIPKKTAQRIFDAETERRKISIYLQGLLEAVFYLNEQQYHPDRWEIIYNEDGSATAREKTTD